jgi:hypothetical protein
MAPTGPLQQRSLAILDEKIPDIVNIARERIRGCAI